MKYERAGQTFTCRDRTVFLLGTDRLGRDLLSRIIYGSRISLTITWSALPSFILGIVIGGLEAFHGLMRWCSG